jgi:DUF971 family protein
MKPSVGRIVHYVSYGTPGGEYPSVCRAAVISAVLTPSEKDVSLVVLNPEGMFFNQNVPYSDDHRGGTWHWPERVEE